MWFLPGGDKDWLAAVYRDPGGEFTLRYRFRYYKSPDPWDDRDEKNWYTGIFKPPRTEEEIVAKVDFLAQSMECMGFGGKVCGLVLRTDDPQRVAEEMGKQSWSHMKKMFATAEPGARVRMSEDLKKKLRGECTTNTHVAEMVEGAGNSCMKCSTAHVEEFGDSVGVVRGPTDYNNCKPGEKGYDPAKVGPEVDVYWPENLRYAYLPSDLELAK